MKVAPGVRASSASLTRGSTSPKDSKPASAGDRCAANTVSLRVATMLFTGILIVARAKAATGLRTPRS